MNRCLVRCLDDQQCLLAVTLTHGSAEDDEALLDERIHERRVRVPSVLIPSRPTVVPCRPLFAYDEKPLAHSRIISELQPFLLEG